MQSIQTRVERAKEAEETEAKIRDLQQKRDKVLDNMLDKHPELTVNEITDLYIELTKIGKQINHFRQKLI